MPVIRGQAVEQKVLKINKINKSNVMNNIISHLAIHVGTILDASEIYIDAAYRYSKKKRRSKTRDNNNGAIFTGKLLNIRTTSLGMDTDVLKALKIKYMSVNHANETLSSIKLPEPMRQLY